MKRNPHIIVQQVCPIEKNKDGGTHPWKVCVYAFHKGLNASLTTYYRTKKMARREQHILCRYGPEWTVSYRHREKIRHQKMHHLLDSVDN